MLKKVRNAWLIFICIFLWQYSLNIDEDIATILLHSIIPFSFLVLTGITSLECKNFSILKNSSLFEILEKTLFGLTFSFLFFYYTKPHMQNY